MKRSAGIFFKFDDLEIYDTIWTAVQWRTAPNAFVWIFFWGQFASKKIAAWMDG